MAGLPIPSIQTVTAKVQLSQSSVLGNIFLEDTQVSHGVSDMINFILSLASQAQAVSQRWSYCTIAVTEKYGRRVFRNLKNIDTVWLANLTKRFSSTLYNLLSLHISLLIHDGFREISGWKGTEKIEIRHRKNSKSIILRIFWLKHRDKQADRNYCIVIQYGLPG